MEIVYKKPRLIAEAGCNHKGDIEIAKELIRTAAIYCKADVIKFQKRCNKELLTPEQYNALIRIRPIHMERHMENTANFLNLRQRSTEN